MHPSQIAAALAAHVPPTQLEQQIGLRVTPTEGTWLIWLVIAAIVIAGARWLIRRS